MREEDIVLMTTNEVEAQIKKIEKEADPARAHFEEDKLLWAIVTGVALRERWATKTARELYAFNRTRGYVERWYG